MVKAKPHISEKLDRRDRIVMAALPHVMFDGWNAKTLRRAASDIGLTEADADLAFPDGARDAVAHFVDLADRMMIGDLARHDMTKLKHREKIALIVRLRLQRWTPHREAVRRALALAPMPAMAGDAVRGWFGTVDAMWKAIGDKSIDFSFYTKRALLAAVYGSTVLYWLDDKSEGCAGTWAFLDRRIDDVMKVPKVRAKLEERLKKLPSPLRIIERLRGRGARFGAKQGA
ncbi:MAG: COQ9 family protein [Rhodospirillaceae bacterium]|nr:COQ9 family protein [Rhodospirillaceae bacterium]